MLELTRVLSSAVFCLVAASPSPRVAPPPAQEAIFPDQAFQQPVSFVNVVIVFIFLTISYMSMPWALVYHAKSVPEWLPCAAISVFCTGELLFSETKKWLHGVVGQETRETYYIFRAYGGREVVRSVLGGKASCFFYRM